MKNKEEKHRKIRKREKEQNKPKTHGYLRIKRSKAAKSESIQFIENLKNFVGKDSIQEGTVFFGRGNPSNSSNNITIPKNFDWRDIREDDIKNGAGNGYGKNLSTGNYVKKVINQHVPVYTGSCWVQSSTHVYSDTHKIAEVASGEKNITLAEISRRDFSVQYILDYLGSPGATYKSDMESERQKLKDKAGAMYRGGSQPMFCRIINDFKQRNIGIPSEDYNPWIGHSRDYPNTNTDWYKIQQYDSESTEISGNYLEGSIGKLPVAENEQVPSTYPANNVSKYSSGNTYKSDPNFVFPLKNINDYSFDLTGGKVNGYEDYTKNVPNIEYGTFRISDDETDDDYKEIADNMMKFIFLCGPLNVAVQARNFEAQTRNIDGNQYYSYEEFNNDAIAWQNNEMSNETFNEKYDNTSTNHAVYCVGWKTNIKTGKSLWIIKNSWGSGYGDYGYMYIPMGINASSVETYPDYMTHTDYLTEDLSN